MSEVEKLSHNQDELESTDSPRPLVPTTDVSKVVRQYLESLQRAGLTDLPHGTGEHTFDWTPLEPSSTPADQRTQTNPPLAKTSPDADLVKETPFSKSGIERNTKVSAVEDSNVEDPKVWVPPGRVSAAAPQTIVNLSSDPWGKGLALADRKTALRVLQEQVSGCEKCAELSSQRTQTVFGVGNPAARLVFVGEAPGAQEDRVGEPFVGEAGQLLDKILSSCKLDRADVYILNTVKCRPPGNRNPGQEEIAQCWGYAKQQLEILQPEFICCLGSVASRTLLKTTQSLGKLRQRFHTYRGSRVLVTYHPAYLLRTPSAKRHVWDDMKMLMKEMGVDLSK